MLSPQALAHEWHRLVLESKQKLGLLDHQEIVKQLNHSGQMVALSPETVQRLTAQQREYVARRDRLAGELHQLKLEQKEISSSNVIMRKGKPRDNRALHSNLKIQVSGAAGD